MLKRTWIVAIGLLALALALSACDAESELAPELTPIPTLPPGQEPALVDALQQAPAADDMDDATAPSGDPLELGEQLFAQTCAACHMDVNTIGPGLPHIAEEAPSTAAELGMSTEEYLHQSIVDPGAYVVEGFQPIMPPGYGDQYSEEEIQALITYIMAQSDEDGHFGEGAMEETEAGETEALSGEDAMEEAGAADAEAPADEAETDEVALVEQGEQLFTKTCMACHTDTDAIGPGLPHIAASAPEIAAELGMSTEEYLHQSIVDPSAYVVEGFQPIMPPGYGDQYTEDELQALIAYILAQGETETHDEGAMEEAAPTDEGTAEDSAADEGAMDAEETMVDEALVEQGEQLFARTCLACHMNVDTIGPGLPHIAASAPEIAAELGMSTEEYLHQSIVEPGAYVVEGFQPIMPPGYGDQYTEDELQALIAYIMAQGEAEHGTD